MIWAVVLGAGESKRMGSPKQLLPFGRTTVIETALEHILASKVDGTLVVLGANRERIEAVIQDLPIQMTVNPDFRSGMLSSAQWGIRRLPGNARAALIFLADQPWIRASTIDRVIDEYGRTSIGLVLPVHGNSGGHPLLIDLKYRTEIEDLSPDTGLRELLSRHPEDVRRIEIDDPDILRDLDTPLQYKEIK